LRPRDLLYWGALEKETNGESRGGNSSMARTQKSNQPKKKVSGPGRFPTKANLDSVERYKSKRGKLLWGTGERGTSAKTTSVQAKGKRNEGYNVDAARCGLKSWRFSAQKRGGEG